MLIESDILNTADQLNPQDLHNWPQDLTNIRWKQSCDVLWKISHFCV